jgi:hypothetical protein
MDARGRRSSWKPPIKNSTWFDTVTLLLISLMSIASGVAEHVG